MDMHDNVRQARARGNLASAVTTGKRETLEPSPERGERKDRFATVSNHEVDRLYTPDDISDLDFEKRTSAFPANHRTLAVHIRRCTADERGRCDSSLALAPQKRPTSAFTI